MKYDRTLRKLSRQNKLSAELIIAFFKKHEGVDVTINKKSIGQCQGYDVATNLGVVYLPKYPISRYNKKQFRVTNHQERMHDFSCLFPLNMGMGNGECN